MNSAMRMFCILAGILGAWPVVHAAEVRVLLSFDNSGHRVEQIMQFDSATHALSQRPVNAVPEQNQTLESAILSLQPRMATLIWLDAQGRWRAQTTEPDPRVAHSPAHIDGTDSGLVGEVAGAWLVSGPDSASSLTILLPADVTLGLGFEQWTLSLSGS